MTFETIAPGLVRCASSSRIVKANAERIFENVLDWQHLPHLHRSSFARVELIKHSAAGFRAHLCGVESPDRRDLVEVFIERDRLRYWNVTSHNNKPLAQVRVVLTELGPRKTQIDLEFFLRESSAAQGPAFAESYDHLWDEDEIMMIARQEFLDRAAGGPTEIDLGNIGVLRNELPMTVRLGRRDYRLISDEGGQIRVFDSTCPHWGGPVEEKSSREGLCPWHGYRFDLATGDGIGDHGCRLRPPARLIIDAQGACRLQVPD